MVGSAVAFEAVFTVLGKTSSTLPQANGPPKVETISYFLQDTRESGLIAFDLSIHHDELTESKYCYVEVHIHTIC